MADPSLGTVVGFLRQLVGGGTTVEDSDAELLDRFRTRQDQSAFARLVRRHADLVFGVCRRVLRDPHAAEDAFQATFFVFARKAHAIRRGESVASWLHRVALHVALKARAKTARQPETEQAVVEIAPAESAEPSEADLAPHLDEAIRWLPWKYRAPFLMTCLEGRSRQETARELGWKEGTVASRVARAKELLRRRLAKHVACPSAVALAQAIASPARAVAPPHLVDNAIRIGSLAPEAIAQLELPVQASTLARETIRDMFVQKMVVAASIYFFGLSLLGAGLLYHAADGGAANAPNDEPPVKTVVEDAPLPRHAIRRIGSTKFSHGYPITSCAVSDDGALLATAGGENWMGLKQGETYIRIWDARTGAILRVLPGEDKERRASVGIKAVAFSPDASLLATAGPHNVAYIWDVKSGKIRGKIENVGETQMSSVMKVEFTRNGRFLVAAGTRVEIVPSGSAPPLGPKESYVVVWNVQSGTEIQRWEGKHDFAIAPNGKSIAVWGLDSDENEAGISVWDLATRARRAQLTPDQLGERTSPMRASFSRDGQSVAMTHWTSEGDKVDVATWNLRTGEKECEVPSAFAMSGDGRLCAVAAKDERRVAIVQLPGAKEAATFDVNPEVVRSVRFSPDGKFAVVIRDDKVSVWDIASGRERLIVADMRRSPTSVSFSSDDSTLALVENSRVRLFDLVRFEEIQRRDLGPAEPTAISFADGGETLVVSTGLWWPGIQSWTVRSGKRGPDADPFADSQGEFERNHTDITALSDDGSTLAMGSHSRAAIRIANARTGKFVREIEAEIRGCWSLAISPNGRWLLLGGGDSRTRVWDVTNGKEVYCGDQRGQPYSFGRRHGWAISTDGSLLAENCGRDIHLVDVRANNVARTLKHDAPAEVVAMSHDGARIATFPRVNAPGILWDAKSGKKIGEIEGVATLALAACFSPDGKLLAVADATRTIHVCDGKTGKSLRRLQGHEGITRALAFSPDGRTLASASEDTTILLWDVNVEK
jgi:RNA polymerase sigma factor (sigma-70 family)